MGQALQPMREAFLRVRKLKLNKPTSLRFATYQVELLCDTLSQIFPSLLPERLTLEHLEQMVEQQVSGELGHQFKPSTLKQHVMYVRCIFRFWHKRGYLPSNPASDLVYCPTAEPQETRWIRNEEIAKLFTVANTEAFVDLRETALMYLMLDIGPPFAIPLLRSLRSLVAIPIGGGRIALSCTRLTSTTFVSTPKRNTANLG